jgi:hypothetical protein
LVLQGVYTVDDGDAGLSASGDVIRFAGNQYSIHHVPCTASPVYPEDADVPDESIPDGCTSYGTFSLSADGTRLSLTDDSTGATTTTPFQALATTSVGDDGGGPVGLASGLRILGAGAGAGAGEGGVSLSGPQQTLTSGLVTLYKAGVELVRALPCSGESANLGAATGAMIRTATATSFTCIQSKISFPSYDIPTGPNGASYCTSFSQKGCTAANYYGRRGVPFIYYTFVSTAGRAECGFEYQPGVAKGAAQGNPRWSPYIRDTSGAYVYGANADQRSGTTATVWCGIEPSGLVRMKIDGSFVNMASGSGTTPLTSKLSFSGQAVHAFRVTGLAWPETATQNVATAKANGTYFPPYTCQPMNQLGPVVYTDTEVCQGSSMTPSVPYTTGPGGNARWTGGGDGYTLSPASEVTETQSGSTDTDTIFPGGG